MALDDAVERARVELAARPRPRRGSPTAPRGARADRRAGAGSSCCTARLAGGYCTERPTVDDATALALNAAQPGALSRPRRGVERRARAARGAASRAWRPSCAALPARSAARARRRLRQRAPRAGARRRARHRGATRSSTWASTPARRCSCGARARAAAARASSQADFVASPPDVALPAGRFELVALFGVLHAIPGRARRRALLAAAAARTAPGGLLALSRWRFAESAERRTPHRALGAVRRLRRSADRPRVSSSPATTCSPSARRGALRYGHAIDAERARRAARRTAARSPQDEWCDDGRDGEREPLRPAAAEHGLSEAHCAPSALDAATIGRRHSPPKKASAPRAGECSVGSGSQQQRRAADAAWSGSPRCRPRSSARRCAAW